MAEGKKSPYCCGFCREQLVTVPPKGWDFAWLLLLLRPYMCPHCFGCVSRPFCWIGRFPLLGRLFRDSGVTDRAKKIPGVLPQRPGDINGPVNRSLALVGRFVSSAEEQLWKFCTAPFRIVWAAVTLGWRKIFRRRRRGKHKNDNRFLPSQRD